MQLFLHLIDENWFTFTIEGTLILIVFIVTSTLCKKEQGKNTFLVENCKSDCNYQRNSDVGQVNTYASRA